MSPILLLKINRDLLTVEQLDDPSTSSDEMILNEVTTNLTAPMILARLFMPHLVKVGGTFMVTSSGIGFVPMGTWPTCELFELINMVFYLTEKPDCATKAAIHAYLVGIRQQLNGKVNIIEIVPPLVATELSPDNKVEKGAMSLAEYTDKTFEIFDNADDAKELKEVAISFAEDGVKAWRGAVDPFLEKFQLGG